MKLIFWRQRSFFRKTEKENWDILNGLLVGGKISLSRVYTWNVSFAQLFMSPFALKVQLLIPSFSILPQVVAEEVGFRA